MEENKKLYIQNINQCISNSSNQKKQPLSEKIKNKMKDWISQNFNFILEKNVIELSEDIPELSSHDERQKIQYFSNYEIKNCDSLFPQNIRNYSPAKIPPSFYNSSNFS